MLAELEKALEPFGMFLRGVFTLSDKDQTVSLNSDKPARAGVLIGNAGPTMWSAFLASDAKSRFASNPMDNWTRQVLNPVADRFGLTALYPFEGPPYHPFQRWAKCAEPVSVSPLRILMHPTFGLWHAYRAAFMLTEYPRIRSHDEAASHCLTCEAKPCLSTCPVGAVTQTNINHDKCAQHVESAAGRECRHNGCLARNVCPIANEYSYAQPQKAFHMEAFLKNRN